MDHTDELEVLCQAANHLNESGGESGGEFWLQAEEKKGPLESGNSNYEEKIAKNVPTTTTTTSDKSVTDLVVI